MKQLLEEPFFYDRRNNRLQMRKRMLKLLPNGTLIEFLRLML
jgi:hypothetical protein